MPWKNSCPRPISQEWVSTVVESLLSTVSPPGRRNWSRRRLISRRSMRRGWRMENGMLFSLRRWLPALVLLLRWKPDWPLGRLGTTRANAGSAAAFEKIDREWVDVCFCTSVIACWVVCHRYVINSARAAKSDSSTQRLVYVSVSSINPILPHARQLTPNYLSSVGWSESHIQVPISQVSSYF